MESLIAKLFFNDGRLSQEDSHNQNETLLSEKENILKNTLNAEQTKAFNEYRECKDNQCANDCLDAYCNGFKYAVKLFAEALKDKK